MTIAYNAAKHGVNALTKTAAMENGPHGIRVNSISPGYMTTEMVTTVRKDWIEKWTASIPAGRMGTPDELAGAVVWLFSDASTFALGTDIIIDGGASIF